MRTATERRRTAIAVAPYPTSSAYGSDAKDVTGATDGTPNHSIVDASAEKASTDIPMTATQRPVGDGTRRSSGEGGSVLLTSALWRRKSRAATATVRMRTTAAARRPACSQISVLNAKVNCADAARDVSRR